MKKNSIIGAFLIISFSTLQAVEISSLSSQARKKINDGDSLGRQINQLNNTYNDTKNEQTKKGIYDKMNSLRKTALKAYKQAVNSYQKADKLPGLNPNQKYFITNQIQEINDKADSISALQNWNN